MNIVLDAVELRVLGCLLEKQLATPQYYPLTLNALVAAANQSSNRDPVADYAEHEIAGALASLREQGLVRVMHSASNRAAKYRHVLDEMWGLDDAHRSVLAVLMLRGPQTLGELRARTERLAAFDRLADVEEVLDLLRRRADPLVRHLERQPGQKEARYAQLFSPVAVSEHRSEPEHAGSGEDDGRHLGRDRMTPAPGSTGGIDEATLGIVSRVSALEGQVLTLRADLEAARAELGELSELRRLLD